MSPLAKQKQKYLKLIAKLGFEQANPSETSTIEVWKGEDVRIQIFFAIDRLWMYKAGKFRKIVEGFDNIKTYLKELYAKE